MYRAHCFTICPEDNDFKCFFEKHTISHLSKAVKNKKGKKISQAFILH